MARSKKAATTLTPEEKLQQALVPVEDQPYEIPENWCWIKLYACCEDYFSGKSPKYSKEKTDYPIIGQQANQRYGIDLKYVKYGTKEFAEKQEDRYFLRYNDVLLNTLGTGSIGRSGIFKFEEKILTDGHPFVFRTGKKYNPDLLYYFLQINEEQIINTANGSTNQKFLSLGSFSQYSIPFPPLVEQQRIVERIESIFAKLDEAKEKAQAVVDGFELRKSAILHKAFTGELTAQWRQEHGVELESWEETKLEKVIKLLSGQDFKPAQYNDTNDGLPYITGASNFDGDHVIINRWTPSPSVIAQKDDVLVVCKGSGYGKTIIADFDKAHIARQIMAIRVNGRVSNRFILYYLQSEYEYLRNSGQGLIPGIARNIILNMPISVPPIEEQYEIVEIIERVFSREQQAKDAAEAVIYQIDTMKKAVLARAFRGELGTNDSTEESAMVLLKELL